MHMTPVNTNFAPIVMEVGGRQSNAFAYLCSKWPIRLDTILAVLMKNLARTDLRRLLLNGCARLFWRLRLSTGVGTYLKLD
mmetsp:Transcript_8422/g.10652  ORF Transcript_8422/g.10652 Transcript_8422/m.10652 type:complete len:81 (-) Transcript_8422:679-921(-)